MEANSTIIEIHKQDKKIDDLQKTIDGTLKTIKKSIIKEFSDNYKGKTINRGGYELKAKYVNVDIWRYCKGDEDVSIRILYLIDGSKIKVDETEKSYIDEMIDMFENNSPIERSSKKKTISLSNNCNYKLPLWEVLYFEIALSEIATKGLNIHIW